MLTLEMLRYSFVTRNGVQDAAANYVIRVSMFRRGTTSPLLVYEDMMNRVVLGTHDDLPDRFTYSFFNLLKEHGRWPAAQKLALGD